MAAKSNENDLQLMRILQRRHIYQRPVEMLVKVKVIGKDGNYKLKEIWFSKTYIQSQETGRHLINEFNQTKVSELGVDMYLGRRRSSSLRQSDVNKPRAKTNRSSASTPNTQEFKRPGNFDSSNTSSLKIPKKSSSSSNLHSMIEENKEANNNADNANTSLVLAETKLKARRPITQSKRGSNINRGSNGRNRSRTFDRSNVDKRFRNRRQVSGQSSESFNAGDNNTCSDDGILYSINSTRFKKQNGAFNECSQNKNTRIKMISNESSVLNPSSQETLCYPLHPPRLYPIIDVYPDHPLLAAFTPKDLTPPETVSDSEKRSSVRQIEGVAKYKDIVVRRYPGYLHVILWTRMEVKVAFKNCFNPAVFSELNTVLRNAIFDETKVVLLSGSGDMFSSGIDLHYLTEAEVDRATAARKMVDGLREFINTIISFPKPLLVAVNGPAVGLAASFLPLFDIVYASDKASFSCPYISLCQTPEGCASHTFPRILGVAMANEILLRGRRITALEAQQVGLVSQVFWPDHLMGEVIPRVQQLTQQSTKALEYSKELIRCRKRGKLETVNSMECRLLAERWASNECQLAMKKFIENTLDFL